MTNDYARQVQSWLAAYQPPAQPAIRCDIRPHEMEFGRAYCGDGWALCRYIESGLDLHTTDGEVAQPAFNAVAACVPEDIRSLPPHRGGPDWTWIPPQRDMSDPLSQSGYVGAKWKA